MSPTQSIVSMLGRRFRSRAVVELEKVAEREGFEPPEPLGSPDFESGRLNQTPEPLRDRRASMFAHSQSSWRAAPPGYDLRESSLCRDFPASREFASVRQPSGPQERDYAI